MRTLILVMLSAALLAAQQQPKAAPPPYTPTAVEKDQIAARCAELRGLVNKLPQNALHADVAIYLKAGDYILGHPEEFSNAGYVKDTLAVLDKGIARAKELAAGSPSWPAAKGHLIRGFVSSVDNSVQPYGLVVPESYNGSPVRLDISMHGTDRNLNEVNFIKRQDTGAAAPEGQNFIQLNVYGRSNVSYRWAGETDVFEALKSVEERYHIDPKRIVLRGFSMGGAGAWHLGLHHPDEWVAVEAGAGYVETKIYAKKDVLPPYQETALHYYDAMDYALNAVNYPFVGYGGELDPQLKASQTIQAQLQKEGVKPADMRGLFLVGPGVPHRWEPATHKVSERFVDEAAAKGLQTPSHIRFVTYTTRFNRCFWVTVEELQKTYERADVDASRDDSRSTLATRNVARIRVDGPGAVVLDGESFPRTGVFERADGKWTEARAEKGLHKRHGLQGPVDDAFMESFLCVRPTHTGTAATAYGLEQLKTLQHDFSKWLRGDPRVKDDRDVSASDIANNNLILYGDPWSNSVIARIVGKLPIQWSKTKITLEGRTVDAETHAPVLVYPNPLNPNRYVVINGAHTFSDSDWRGTNANLYPHIGDYALMAVKDQSIVSSGFFDEHWK